jgi:hypothetical protein
LIPWATVNIALGTLTVVNLKVSGGASAAVAAAINASKIPNMSIVDLQFFTDFSAGIIRSSEATLSRLL